MFRKLLLAAGAAILVIAPSSSLAADNEVSLFDAEGKATAYIAVDDGMTIYLWSGKPVAYLDPANDGSFNVYGFNGNHLGWFIKGAIWNHEGTASCAVRERTRLPQLEPLKSLKELKPLKSLKTLAPLKPLLTDSFGDSCVFLLASGGD